MTDPTLDPLKVLRALVEMERIIPLAHRHDPITAKQAAARVAGYQAAQAVKALYWIIRHEPGGRTYWEVESELPMRSAKQRISDLKKVGLLYATGETRVTKWGSPAGVHRPTARVLQALDGSSQPSLFGLALEDYK